MAEVVIVGAGVGGLSMAIALKTRLGITSFKIYETESDIGGTWRDNVYPGASSDIPIHFYSLSSDLNPDWSSTHGSQEDIHTYWKALVAKYELYPHIAFNQRVVSADWNPQKHIYELEIDDVPSGIRTTTTARVLLSAVGILTMPNIPAIPGLKAFKGEIFHTARWRKDVSLHGKRVALIGSGTSAAQILPHISKNPTVKLTQFCRTPGWLFPPVKADYTPAWKWAFRHLPYAIRLNRMGIFLRAELIYFLLFSNAFLRSLITPIVKRYMTQTAPTEYSKQLIPKYTIGCKRLLIDAGYLTSLHRPNVSLNWDGIESAYDDGLITKTGKMLPFDVMILGTGFISDVFALPIHSRDGTSIQKYYDSKGGPTAYMGTAIPGFPNLFLISGPNTGTGSTSVIFFQECQITYILQLIRPILTGRLASLEVTALATDRYNEAIQARLKDPNSTHTSCLSWYRTGGAGKNYNIFPGSGTLFWWWMRRPRWEDYTVVEAGHGTVLGWGHEVKREKVRRVMRRVLLAALLVVVAVMRFT
ncbi:hypothetical protein C8R43DRAFT_986451 [Mycena crocata]|nr:hypothetical protein C8R43DRAFT_986451 [Mycena crocata]